MKDALLKLLAMLTALLQTPPENEDSIAKQKQAIQDHRDWIDTAHGDSELNDPEIAEAIKDLTTLCETSTPHPEYALDPEDAVEGEKKPEPEEEDEDAPGKEESEAEEATAEESEEEEAEEEETAVQKRKRLAKEKADAEAAKKKKKNRR